MPTKASFRETKAIGIVSCILLLIGAIGNLDSVLAIVALILGLVFLLLTTRNLSELTANKTVYTSMRIAFICALIGTTVGALTVFQGFRGTTSLGSAVSSIDYANFIGTILEGLAIVWVFLIAAAIFTRRSLRKLSFAVKIPMFRLAGDLFVIGAFLVILLGLGFIIIFIAVATLLTSFFSLGDELPPIRKVDVLGRPITTPQPENMKKGQN